MLRVPLDVFEELAEAVSKIGPSPLPSDDDWASPARQSGDESFVALPVQPRTSTPEFPSTNEMPKSMETTAPDSLHRA